MWVMTRVALGNALVSQIVFREHRGLDSESEYAARGREVQLRVQLRYEIQFRNEPSGGKNFCVCTLTFRMQRGTLFYRPPKMPSKRRETVAHVESFDIRRTGALTGNGYTLLR